MKQYFKEMTIQNLNKIKRLKQMKMCQGEKTLSYMQIQKMVEELVFFYQNFISFSFNPNLESFCIFNVFKNQNALVVIFIKFIAINIVCFV